jgi:hypothetical protein
VLLTAHGLRLTGESEAVLDWEPATGEGGPVAQVREIEVRGVARFRVTGGTQVRITRAEGADPVEVRASLEGRVTAALLQQRGTLPLHLAAVVVGGQAIGFAGPPGSGQSSLACALADRGHHLLTDDLGAVSYDASGRPALHPGSPVMRIWGSSARQLGWPTDDRHRIKDHVDKYSYELADRFADGPKPLVAVYAFLHAPGARIQIRPMHGLERLTTYLVGATYSRELMDSPAARSWHFTQVCRIADLVPTFNLGRGPGDLQLETLAAEVERHAGSLLAMS